MKNEPIRTLGIERDWHAKPNSSFVPHFKVHKLVDDFGTAKKYQTAGQPKARTRKPRTRNRVLTVQIVNERLTDARDVRLALAQQMARDFYTAEPEFKLNYALLSR